MHANMMNDEDVRMIECTRGLRFLFEAIKSIRVLGQRSGQNFDCDVAVQLRIPRPVHLAHAAGADFLSDAIVREGFANHVWRIVLLG